MIPQRTVDKINEALPEGVVFGQRHVPEESQVYLQVQAVFGAQWVTADSWLLETARSEIHEITMYEAKGACHALADLLRDVADELEKVRL